MKSAAMSDLEKELAQVCRGLSSAELKALADLSELMVGGLIDTSDCALMAEYLTERVKIYCNGS